MTGPARWRRDGLKALAILAAATLVAVAVNALRPEPWPWVGAASEPAGATITPAGLRGLRGTVMFVDTRDEEAFARGHVAGAIHWPAGQAARHPETADDWLSPQDQVVLYGSGQPGAGERLLLGLLRQNGFDAKRARMFTGGWPGLRALTEIPKVGD